MFRDDIFEQSDIIANILIQIADEIQIPFNERRISMGFKSDLSDDIINDILRRETQLKTLIELSSTLISQGKDKINELSQHKEALEQETLQLKEEMAFHNDRENQMRENMGKLEDKYIKLEKYIKELESTVEQNRDQVNQAKAEITLAREFKQKFEEMNSKLHSTQDKAAKLDNDLRLSLKRNDDLTYQLNDSTTEIQKLNKTIEQLKLISHQYESLKKDLVKTYSESRDAKTKYENEINDLENTLDQMRVELDQEKNEKLKLLRKIQTLENIQNLANNNIELNKEPNGKESLKNNKKNDVKTIDDTTQEQQSTDKQSIDISGVVNIRNKKHLDSGSSSDQESSDYDSDDDNSSQGHINDLHEMEIDGPSKNKAGITATAVKKSDGRTSSVQNLHSTKGEPLSSNADETKKSSLHKKRKKKLRAPLSITNVYTIFEYHSSKPNLGIYSTPHEVYEPPKKIEELQKKKVLDYTKIEIFNKEAVIKLNSMVSMGILEYIPRQRRILGVVNTSIINHIPREKVLNSIKLDDIAYTPSIQQKPKLEITKCEIFAKNSREKIHEIIKTNHTEYIPLKKPLEIVNINVHSHVNQQKDLQIISFNVFYQEKMNRLWTKVNTDFIEYRPKIPSANITSTNINPANKPKKNPVYDITAAQNIFYEPAPKKLEFIKFEIFSKQETKSSCTLINTDHIGFYPPEKKLNIHAIKEASYYLSPPKHVISNLSLEVLDCCVYTPALIILTSQKLDLIQYIPSTPVLNTKSKESIVEYRRQLQLELVKNESIEYLPEQSVNNNLILNAYQTKSLQANLTLCKNETVVIYDPSPHQRILNEIKPLKANLAICKSQTIVAYEPSSKITVEANPLRPNLTLCKSHCVVVYNPPQQVFNESKALIQNLSLCKNEDVVYVAPQKIITEAQPVKPSLTLCKSNSIVVYEPPLSQKIVTEAKALRSNLTICKSESVIAYEPEQKVYELKPLRMNLNLCESETMVINELPQKVVSGARISKIDLTFSKTEPIAYKLLSRINLTLCKNQTLGFYQPPQNIVHAAKPLKPDLTLCKSETIAIYEPPQKITNEAKSNLTLCKGEILVVYEPPQKTSHEAKPSKLNLTLCKIETISIYEPRQKIVNEAQPSKPNLTFCKSEIVAAYEPPQKIAHEAKPSKPILTISKNETISFYEPLPQAIYQVPEVVRYIPSEGKLPKKFDTNNNICNKQVLSETKFEIFEYNPIKKKALSMVSINSIDFQPIKPPKIMKTITIMVAQYRAKKQVVEIVLDQIFIPIFSYNPGEKKQKESCGSTNMPISVMSVHNSFASLTKKSNTNTEHHVLPSTVISQLIETESNINKKNMTGNSNSLLDRSFDASSTDGSDFDLRSRSATNMIINNSGSNNSSFFRNGPPSICPTPTNQNSKSLPLPIQDYFDIACQSVLINSQYYKDLNMIINRKELFAEAVQKNLKFFEYHNWLENRIKDIIKTKLGHKLNSSMNNGNQAIRYQKYSIHYTISHSFQPFMLPNDETSTIPY